MAVRPTKIPKEDVVNVHQISIYSFSEDQKTINGTVIGKKFTSYNNVFYYMKTVAIALEEKVSDLKRYSSVDADEYDLMYVMVKKIKEAVVDAYNEYNKIIRKKGRAPL